MTEAGPLSAESSTSVDYVALAAGRKVGRYEILGVLGQGGFGITYRALDGRLGREVALKEYLPTALVVRQDGASVLPRSTDAASDFARGRERFIAEGRTLAGLHDAPAMVKVFDFLEDNGTAYIVMELLRGATLEQRVGAQGPLTAVEMDRVLWPLLEGLQKVHQVGFLHCDIKPANVLLSSEGKPTLIDFGASRAAIAGRTVAMTAVFTPGYAAPEQFTAAARQGPWTDIYGLAATLYYAVTGQAPPSAFDRLIDDAYEPLVRRQPQGFSRSVLAGLDAALSIHAEQRPQTIVAWRRLLGTPAPLGEPTVVMARPSLPTSPERPAPPAVFAVTAGAGGRSRWVAVAAVVALMLAGAAYYGFGPSSHWAANQPADGETTRALKESETARRNAEADRLKAEAARRNAESSAADRKRADEAAARQKAEGDARRRTDDQARNAEEETRVRSAAASSAAFDGAYRGSLTEATTQLGGGRIMPAVLRLAGTSLSGQIEYARCGALAVSLVVSPSGEVSGTVRVPDVTSCAPIIATASGKVSGLGLQLELRGVGSMARGMLVKAREAAPALADGPSSQQPSLGSGPTTAAAPGNFNGSYAGSLSTAMTGGQGGRPVAMELLISGGRLTGRLIHATCGPTPISLPVDDSGAISGVIRVHDPGNCSLGEASVSGKASANALALDIRAISMSARGTLPRRAP